ncbi:helix-turn-helix transcriptional regulator [Actinospongicola halichondriae]|uniref:helix-turn-helix transcriptional regulator n=1 Tax=Actinospongicola halichondriae TaxID=3236844 RepID=UPI003D4D3C81
MSADGAITPPPGRSVEAERLVGALDALERGSGGVVVVSGEGGVGKTTLSAWAAEDARRRGALVLDAPCFSLSVDTPYACLVAAFGPVLRGERVADPAALTDGLSSLSLLFDGIAGQHPPLDDGALNRTRLHGALATVVSRMTGVAPVVLVVDDLHWADSASIEVLHVLANDLPDVALLIVATLRPFESSERAETRGLLRSFRRSPWGQVVEVGGLHVEATRALLHQRLGTVIPTGLAELVQARSGGTPLVAEELVEVMIETGALRPIGRRWELRTTDEIPVPAVADELIGDRFSRLDAHLIELVAAVAIGGEPVTTTLLAAITGRDLEPLGRDLESLRRAGLVDRAEVGTQTAWVVHHPIMGEVAVASLAGADVERFHRAFADELADAPVSRRGRHVLGAGDQARTAPHLEILVAAGRAALDRGAPAEACRLLGSALDAIDMTGVATEQRVAVLAMLGQAWGRRGEYLVATDHLDRARELARATGDLRAEAALMFDLQQAAWGGNVGRIDFEAECDELFPRLEAAGEWTAAHQLLRSQLMRRLRSGDASTLRSLVGELERVGALAEDDEADLWSRHLRLLPELQELHDGRELLAELDEMRPLVEHPELVRRNLHERLDLLLLLGTRDEILEAIRDERAHDERWGDRPTWRIALATWDVAAGDGDVARMREIQDMLPDVANERAVGYVAVAETITSLLADGTGTTPPVVTHDGDTVITHLLAMADVWRGAGDGHEAIDWYRQRHYVAGVPVLGPVSAGLAMVRAGDREAASELIERLYDFGGGSGRTAAWAVVLRAELADGAGRAAGHLDAADRFEVLGRPMDAAMCRVAAAEAGGTLTAAQIETAAARFEAAPSPWMLERLRGAVGADLTPSTPGPAETHGLTAREHEVAVEVAQGLSNREVADRLFISIRTVTSHLDHIYTKLGIGSRAELTAIFRAPGADT